MSDLLPFGAALSSCPMCTGPFGMTDSRVTYHGLETPVTYNTIGCPAVEHLDLECRTCDWKVRTETAAARWEWHQAPSGLPTPEELAQAMTECAPLRPGTHAEAVAILVELRRIRAEHWRSATR